MLFFVNPLWAESLEEFKEACELIGYKKATPNFGRCVLELRKKDMSSKPLVPPVVIKKEAQTIELPQSGDGSEGDKICQEYGFKVGKSDYKECRMNLDIAKQQAEAQQKVYDEQVRQYNQQKREYEARVEQAKQAEKRRNVVRLLMYGLNRAGGKTHDEAAPALYGLPAYPRQPRPPIQPMPLEPIGGRTMNCHWDVWRKVYRCQ